MSRKTFSLEIAIQNFLAQFLQKKYNGFKIYAHNLDMFDAVYIIYELV